MPVKCSEIIKVLEASFPLKLAEDYDNTGLIIGDKNKIIKRILLSLDITDAVINESLKVGAEMIITHHPLIFRPVKRILRSDPISSMIIDLIRNDINAYAMHTNFDNAMMGISDILAEMLELSDVTPLSNNHPFGLYKLVVFVPETHHKKVLSAMLDAGAGYIGNYSHCSFSLRGEGTFKPLEGTSPYIGQSGKMENLNEVRIETIVDEFNYKRIINEMLKVHPYEEVAYDIYPLENKINNGTGRMGNLRIPVSFWDFCVQVKDKLKLKALRAGGDTARLIRKVAVVGGAGSEFTEAALKQGCDVIITGDIKHHDALDALNAGINVIDAGHYNTEVVALPYVAKKLSAISDVECIITNVDTNPLNTLCD